MKKESNSGISFFPALPDCNLPNINLGQLQIILAAAGLLSARKKCLSPAKKYMPRKIRANQKVYEYFRENSEVLSGKYADYADALWKQNNIKKFLF